MYVGNTPNDLSVRFVVLIQQIGRLVVVVVIQQIVSSVGRLTADMQYYKLEEYLLM